MRSIILPKTNGEWYHTHAHSSFSVKDSLTPVEDMPKLAKLYGQRAVGLTDHGNMSGAVQFYKSAVKHGVAPMIGVEAYFMPHFVKEKAPKRFHVILLAYTTEGYQNLVRLVTRSFTRERFHHKPHVTLDDFSDMYMTNQTKGIALLTGCFFGWVQQGLATGGVDEAVQRVYDLTQYFDRSYLEIQHHNIYDTDHDDDQIVRDLIKVSNITGIPPIITQDSHYAHETDKPVHEVMKRLGSWSDDTDSAVFPGDSFHFAREEYVKDHYITHPGLWEDGITTLNELYNDHSLTIPELDNYHYKIPQIVFDPEGVLKNAVEKRLQDLNLWGNDEYRDRLDEELDTVRATRMDSYLLLCQEVVAWCESNNVYVQARGSASGSLVCFLLGITSLDPIAFGLRYERFLSKDRTKPPDVDLDVSDDRREQLIHWLKSRFHITHIGTYLTHSINEEGKGSILVAYKQLMRKQGMTDVDARYQTVRDIPTSERLLLERLSTYSVRTSAGTHAAGLVVTTDRASFTSSVPTMLIPSSETTVTQFTGDDVEAMGFVKLDILGLRNLSLAERAVSELGRTTVDWSWVNYDDVSVYAMIGRGNVDGVFQLEGYATTLGCREMKPKNLGDLTALLALYRPACLDTGVKDTFIRRRFGKEKTPQMHPLLMGHLASTHGLPIFQDQVISILRSLKFTPDELTEFLKAVKASNKNVAEAEKVVQRYQSLFRQRSSEHGLSQEEEDWVWTAIEGFSEYGFNKSHAAQYALTAYRMAFLKFHHALEFAGCLLQTTAGTPKESKYIISTRKMGVRLLRPDVNISGHNWTIDRNVGAVRRGLVSIKGVGDAAARSISAAAPFTSLQDLIDRTDSRAVTGGKSYGKTGQVNGTLAKLLDAGALDSVMNNHKET